MTPKRPILRYHGGKWMLAPWIIKHFPAHRLYVEPFGGAGSVLMRKKPAYFEIYNDLDDEIVSLFRVLRDPASGLELQRVALLTPYSRTEFELSYEPHPDPIEQARRTLVRSWLAHGSSGLRGHKTGLRLGSMRERTTAVDDWRKFPMAIPAMIERLREVAIEKRPAAEIMERHDGPETLFYLDPPYMFATRSNKRKRGELYHGYRHEMTDDDHARFLRQVGELKGMVIISGYPADLYDQALDGWRRIERDHYADRGGERTEVLWINAACAGALDAEAAQKGLFDQVSA